MASECGICKGDGVLWCSVRDRLVSVGITPPCVLKKSTLLQQLACVAIILALQAVMMLADAWI